MPFFTPQRIYSVLGASSNASKFGYKITQWYVNNSLPVIPINPLSPSILGLETSKSIQEALEVIEKRYPQNDGLSISVVTPPHVSKQSIESIPSNGNVKSVWFQPGSYDDECLELARAKGWEVIADGHCILVEGESMTAKL
jgi:predicted CoA-binding protein